MQFAMTDVSGRELSRSINQNNVILTQKLRGIQ